MLLGALAALVAAVAIAAAGPSPARATAPALVAGSRPNVVLIIADDQSYRTDEAMRNVTGPDWVDFQQYYVNEALCCPSRSSMLTGQNSNHTGVDTNTKAPRFDDHNTLGTWMQAAGYRTALIGKYLNDFPWRRGIHYVPPGWDEWVSFIDHPGYYHYTLTVNGRIHKHRHRRSDYSTTVFTRRAKQFIRTAHRGRRPFFAVVAPYGPHGPRIPAPRDRGKRASPVPPLLPNVKEADVSDKPLWIRNFPTPDMHKARGQQRGEVKTLHSVDRTVGQIKRQLAATGELDHTVIFYVSDNGFSYGSHNVDGKNCNYQECALVPLRVYATGLGAREIEPMAANVDLAPTIVQLANAQPTLTMDGVSLLPLLNDGTSVRHDVLLHLGHNRGINPTTWGLVNDRYKYVENKGQETELYDLQTDPFELVNRATDPAYAAIRAQLAARTSVLRHTAGYVP